jgi:hypothetical protein
MRASYGRQLFRKGDTGVGRGRLCRFEIDGSRVRERRDSIDRRLDMKPWKWHSKSRTSRSVVVSVVTAAVVAMAGPAPAARTEPARRQLGWVLRQLNGAAADLTIAEIKRHVAPVALERLSARAYMALLKEGAAQAGGARISLVASMHSPWALVAVIENREPRTSCDLYQHTATRRRPHHGTRHQRRAGSFRGGDRDSRSLHGSLSGITAPPPLHDLHGRRFPDRNPRGWRRWGRRSLAGSPARNRRGDAGLQLRPRKCAWRGEQFRLQTLDGKRRRSRLRAIQAVASGDAIFGPAIAERVIQYFSASRVADRALAFPRAHRSRTRGAGVDRPGPQQSGDRAKTRAQPQDRA